MISATFNSDTKIMTAEYAGKVTADDYKNVLFPILEDVKALNEKVHLIVDVTNMDSATLGAAFQDTKLGLEYFKEFDKISVIASEDEAIYKMRKVGEAFTKKMKFFTPDQLDEAAKWAA